MPGKGSECTSLSSLTIDDDDLPGVSDKNKKTFIYKCIIYFIMVNFNCYYFCQIKLQYNKGQKELPLNNTM